MKIIANIGINWWDGAKSDKRAHKLVDAAIEAGVAGVCIPFFRSKIFRDKDTARQTKKFEMREELIYDLIEKIQSSKITAIISPRFPNDVSYLESIGASGYHVQNGDILYKPLLESIAEADKPVYLSTGFSTLDEINTAVEILLGDKEPRDSELVLMHSTGGLPTPMQDARIRAILDLAQEFFPLYVGFESFLSVNFLDYVAMAYNPIVIMRRIDLDDKKGVETDYSLSPESITSLVSIANAMEEVLHPDVDHNGFTRTDFSARQKTLRCKDSEWVIPPNE